MVYKHIAPFSKESLDKKSAEQIQDDFISFVFNKLKDKR